MTLTPAQWVTLEAVANRIIPPDDFAGAWQAGVGDYLSRQLDLGDLQDQVVVYRTGLDALEQETLVSEQQSFHVLQSDQQDGLLSRIEHGHVAAAWPLDPVWFFQMLVTHTMEGFYADPGNGGNREEISWRMIGFEVCG